MPRIGMYAALSLAILALGTGWISFRRRASPSSTRLAGAGAMGLGTIVLILAGLKYGLTLAAVSHLAGR